MKPYQDVTLTRDCEAVQIPMGTKLTLAAGATVSITQSLGGAFTVITDQGFMVRIEGKNADALGRETVASAPAQKTPAEGGASEIERLVWDQLRTCYDPEIPVNIADLGLIYSCSLVSIDNGDHRIEIKMTLTAPGCGMGESLKSDVQMKIQSISGVGEVDVELVWDPPWDRTMMSEAARLDLGMMD